MIMWLIILVMAGLSVLFLLADKYDDDDRSMG